MSSQLKVWLTPMQAVAWIMLRDHQWVQRAGNLQTPGEGHHEEVTLPDGRMEMVHVPGRPGVTTFGLDWEATGRLHTKHPSDTGSLGRIAGKVSDAAIDALLAALRDGRLAGQGKEIGNPRFQPIPPIEWHEMGLREDGKMNNAMVVTTLFPDGSPTPARAHWQDVRLDNGDVLRLWPDEVSRVAKPTREVVLAADKEGLVDVVG